MTARTIVSFLGGVVFAVGLGISGMLQPRVVQGFLDVAGAWNPTLLIMFGAAVLTFGVLQQVAKRWRRPLAADEFKWPKARPIDRALVGGAALFGIGWGLAGICPGPAITAAAWNGSVAVFTGTLVASIAVYDRLRARARQAPCPAETAGASARVS
jgi:uncharacterized protein